MTIKPTQIVQRTGLLFALQTGRGAPATPTAALNAFQVTEADLTLNPTVLDRNLLKPSFSPDPSQVGRKIVTVTFSHEIKGSGDVGTTRPKLGSLLRACSMQETLVAVGAATQIRDAIVNGTVNGPAITIAKGTAPTSHYGSYLLEVTLGGASGTAKMRVSRWNSSLPDATVNLNTRLETYVNDSSTTTLTYNNNPDAPTLTVGGTVAAGNVLYAIIGGSTFRYVVTAADAAAGVPADAVATNLAAVIAADARYAGTAAAAAVITPAYVGGAASVAITSGTTAITLGASGAQITPTWTGNLVVGQQWIITLLEPGYTYEPVSGEANAEFATIWFNKDGNLHKVTDCLGTVQFSGETAAYGQAQFTFTGNYADPVPEPLPTGLVFERTQPQQVELAQMSILGDNDFCAQAFNLNLANDVQAKECMNNNDGYDGAQIVGRSPTGTLNPESAVEPYTAMWRNFAQGTNIPLHWRVGSNVGNIVHFYMGRATYTGLQYGDRNNTVTTDVTFQPNEVNLGVGDDEIRINFS